MKRVAWLMVAVAGLLGGCDKGEQKPLTVKEVSVEIQTPPNVAIDGAGGVNIPRLDLGVMRSPSENKVAFDDFKAAVAAVKIGDGSTGGGAATPPKTAALTEQEQELVGIWKATKIEPMPDKQDLIDAMMKTSIELKADHTFQGMDDGKPSPDADAKGNWTLTGTTLKFSVAAAPEMTVVGKTLTIAGPGGVVLTLEKQ